MIKLCKTSCIYTLYALFGCSWGFTCRILLIILILAKKGMLDLGKKRKKVKYIIEMSKNGIGWIFTILSDRGSLELPLYKKLSWPNIFRDFWILTVREKKVAILGIMKINSLHIKYYQKMLPHVCNSAKLPY